MKVVTSQEMSRIEQWAIETLHCNEETFMLQAGSSVARAVLEWTRKNKSAKKATLLVWKGNKAGDAFVSGCELLQKGFSVRAMHLAPLETCSPLCQTFAKLFVKKGGLIETKLSDFGQEGVLIDGLLGTGFSGKIEGVLFDAIQMANASKLPLFAIDIPSGVNGTNGEVGSIAMQAMATITMGLPKMGLFLQESWNVVGKLHIADFGLPSDAIERAEPAAYLVEDTMVQKLMPPIRRNRHKYQAGFVIGFAGSANYTGAAKLASLAALRSGAGIVKWFYPSEVANEVLDSPPEIIHIPFSQSAWTSAAQKAGAAFLGPGLGRTAERQNEVHQILSDLCIPTVIDADALDANSPFPKDSICTPHRGEMLRLLQEEALSEEELFDRSQCFCDKHAVVLILKGAPTWVFSPNEKPCIIARGDPGMATAGSGDVLSGIVSALLSQKCTTKDAACLGAYLHALAGEMAAKKIGSYGLIASDLIEYLPRAFRSLSQRPFKAFHSKEKEGPFPG